MRARVAVDSCCWLLIALVPRWEPVVVAMFVFAVGEGMQAPRFYEYVADLAPRDQIGTFMGFAFLPVAIGALVAGFLGGGLVQRFIGDPKQPLASPHPEVMWWAVAGIGFAATVAMVLYDRFVGGRPNDTGAPPM